jgi:hypothetical protein
MDKILKILWLVIGILLLLFLPLSGYYFIRDKFFSDYLEPYTDQSLIVGEEQREAIRKGKVIQGLVYDRIERIPGTINYMLPLSALKFNTPKDLENFYHEFENNRSKAGDMNMSSMYGNVNIIFLDIDYKVTNVLLNRKAFIHDHYSPWVRHDPQPTIDPTVKNILYPISFEDTNKDGLLNELDDADLYISEVDGSNLRRITRDLHILDYDFMNNNTEVFIVYERRDSVANEYKRKRFGKYKIENDTFLEFSDLHQKILELEKQLMVDTTQRNP